MILRIYFFVLVVMSTAIECFSWRFDLQLRSLQISTIFVDIKYVRKEQAAFLSAKMEWSVAKEMHNANFAVHVVEYVEIDFHGL